MEEKLTPVLTDAEIESIQKCFLRYQRPLLHSGLEYYKDFYITDDITGLDFKQLRRTKFYKALVDGNHQNHINITIKEAVVKEVYRQIDSLRQLQDFDYEIMRGVNNILEECGIKYAPSLWSYDISMRIAYSIGRDALPKRFVYIFRHAKTGAEILFGQKIERNTLNLSMMQEIFCERKDGCKMLESYEIEQLLCHCRHCLEAHCPIYMNQCERELIKSQNKYKK